jgi:hypothetical protein
MTHTTYRLKLHYTYPGNSTAMVVWPVAYSAREYAEIACATILLYTATAGLIPALKNGEKLHQIAIYQTTYHEGHITTDDLVIERKAA